MSTVLCLGGTGQFGLEAARLLTAMPSVDRVVIAGRDPDAVAAATARLGAKSAARRVEADDDDSLRRAMAEVDVVASALPRAEGRQARVIRAAIEAGAHYCDLGAERPSDALGAAARAAGVTLVTHIGFHPGIIDLAVRETAAPLDTVENVTSVEHWPQLLDAWWDLFDTVIRLPGGRRRGSLGGRLYAALTAPEREPATVAAVIRDACAVPFWLVMAGDPTRWLESVTDLRDPRGEGVDVPLPAGGVRRLRPLCTVAGADDPEGFSRQRAYVTGMSPAFDEAIRAAVHRIASGASAVVEAATLEAAIERDPTPYLLPPAEVASLPSFVFAAVGRTGGAAARSSVHFERFVLDPVNSPVLIAGPLALMVERLLAGELDGRGSLTMRTAVADAERFGRELLRLMPRVPVGARLFPRLLARG